MGDRFQIVYDQRSWSLDAHILLDTATGVNYLLLKNGNQIAAVTPLLDRDGKVVLTPSEREA